MVSILSTLIRKPSTVHLQPFPYARLKKTNVGGRCATIQSTSVSVLFSYPRLQWRLADLFCGVFKMYQMEGWV